MSIDVRLSVYDHTGALLALDASADLAGKDSKYENTPTGCAAAQLELGLTYEATGAKGYYSARNIVELSTGDETLKTASLAGATKLYLSGTSLMPWNNTWEPDAQQIYLWDGATLTMRIPVTGSGSDGGGNYILVGAPIAGGGNPTAIPAYAAGATIGRRRYAGQIVKRTRINQKMPGAMVSCSSLSSRLKEALGTFTITNAANVDIGAAIFAGLSQFTARWPEFTISAGNFPTVGGIASGTWTDSGVDRFIADCINQVTTGDSWSLYVGHDRIVRLIKLYTSAGNTYAYNVTLPQGVQSFEPLTFQNDDQDASGLFNSVKVVGDIDPATKQPVSGIYQDATSIATYGQIDAPAVTNVGVKNQTQAATLAQGITNQFSVAKTNARFRVYTNEPGAGPIGLKTGDIISGVSNVTVSAFESAAPNVYGLAVSVVTTLVPGGYGYQDVQYSAIEPDWNAAMAERTNALATALMKNTVTPVAIDQYCVSVDAFPPAGIPTAGLVVTPPTFLALFAPKTALKTVTSSFTCVASKTNWAWLNSNLTWTVNQTDAVQTGAILFGIFMTNGTSVIGQWPRAPVGVMTIGVGNINVAANLPAPTTSGTPTATSVASPPTSIAADVAIDCTVTNVPQDGSAFGVCYFYRTHLQTAWVPYDEQNFPTMPSPPATQTMPTMVLGQLQNGITYDFGIGYVGLAGYGPVTKIIDSFIANKIVVTTPYMIGGLAIPVISAVTITPTASVNGIAANMSVAFTTTQPTDGSLSRISMWFKVAGAANWVPWASIPAIGLPTPAASQAYTFYFTDLTNGVGYDFGVSLENAQGGEGSVVSIGTSTAQLIAITIPYLVGGIPTAPTFNGESTASRDSLAGVSCTINASFNTLNQPTDGSLSRLGCFIRKHGDTAWTPYTSIPAANVGQSSPSSTGLYPNGVDFNDLTNGVNYDFGFSYENAQGGESLVGTSANLSNIPAKAISIGTPYIIGTTSPTPAITGVTTTPQTSANGVSAAMRLQFTLTNQPIDGSLSRLTTWFRVNKNAYPDTTTPWTFYESRGVPGLPTPSASQVYDITLSDLTNGQKYDFGFTYENAQGQDSATVGTTAALSAVQAAALNIGVSLPFPGATVNSDGTWTNLNQVASATYSPFATGETLEVTCDIKRNTAGGGAASAIFIGDAANTNGVQVLFTGAGVYLASYAAGVQSLDASVTAVADTNWHSFRLVVKQLSGSIVYEGGFDGSALGPIAPATLTAMPANSYTTFFTGDNTGLVRNYLSQGTKDAYTSSNDAFTTLITTKGGHNATDWAGFIELPPNDANAGYESNGTNTRCWDKTNVSPSLSTPLVMDFVFKTASNNEFAILFCADSHTANADASNMYGAQVSGGYLTLYKFIAGAATSLVYGPSPNTSTGDHHLRVIAYYDGTAVNIVAAIDGNTPISWRETANVLTSGYLGIRCSGGAVYARSYDLRLSLADATNLNPYFGLTKNLVPDSDFRFGIGAFWQVVGTISLQDNGAGGGGKAWQMIGTGSPSSIQYGHCDTVQLQTGRTYVLSGYIDATAVTLGRSFWGVYSIGTGTNYITAGQNAGVSGRVQASFTVPSSGLYEILCDTANVTIANGASLLFSEPQIEVGVIATPYMSSVPDNTGVWPYQTSPTAIKAGVDSSGVLIGIKASQTYTGSSASFSNPGTLPNTTTDLGTFSLPSSTTWALTLIWNVPVGNTGVTFVPSVNRYAHAYFSATSKTVEYKTINYGIYQSNSTFAPVTATTVCNVPGGQTVTAQGYLHVENVGNINAEAGTWSVIITRLT